MKTNHYLPVLVTCLMAILFIQPDVFSATPYFQNSDPPSLHLEEPGKKKKCRRCAHWRPDRLFKKGQIDGLVSVGVLPTFLMDDARIISPPISLGLEYRFGEKFSLGTTLGHSISESKPKIVDDGINATWTNHFYHIAFRPTMHVIGQEDWDIYGGFAVGLQFSDVKGSASDQDFDLAEMGNHLGIGGKNTRGTFSGFLGVRRVVAPKWTVGAEVGFSVSIVTIGVTYLLNG